MQDNKCMKTKNTQRVQKENRNFPGLADLTRLDQMTTPETGSVHVRWSFACEPFAVWASRSRAMPWSSMMVRDGHG